MAQPAAITVRRARPADLDVCTSVDAVGRDVIRRKIEQGEILLAELAGAVVGYLRLERLWSRLPFIGLIRIEASHQRQGIGRAMLRFLETGLRGEGHEQLWSSSQVDEPDAQAWHRAVGFEECGVLNGVNKGGVGEVFFRKAVGDG